MTQAMKITIQDGRLHVPDHPIIPYIEGDGVGPDIWSAAVRVLDAAVEKAYAGRRRIAWKEVLAGEKAFQKTGSPLPDETLDAVREHRIAIKGPLTTPVGGGIRSLNVAIRQKLDLYACIRPIRYFQGIGSPVKHPEKVDFVIFRENTEDLYAGIEWRSGSKEAKELIEILAGRFGATVRSDSGIGIKPMSPFASKRLVAHAIRYAIESGRDSVTLVHKGNIMKFTEGAFKEWGYEVAKEQFASKTIPEADLGDDRGAPASGKVVIKDRIADAMFQQILLRPEEYSVIATPNLNGDYLSDASAALVGGLGLAPGANVNEDIAFFEATHGTAPKYAGQDKVNPGSLILSGVMMLEQLGWKESAALVVAGLEAAIRQKTVTYDLARQIEGAKVLKCSEFGSAIIANL